MANKKQTSVPILGIDTASPDHNVKDGKCSDLHNLRYSAGAWRNVHPFIKKQDIQHTDVHIIYHHPADADNRYIATSKNGQRTETYYAWKQNDGYSYLFSLIEPEQIKVGDPLYIQDDLDDDPSHFVESSKVLSVNTDGSISCHTDVWNGAYYYAWSHNALVGGEKETRYTLSNTPQVGDDVFRYTDDNHAPEVVGTVASVEADMSSIAVDFGYSVVAEWAQDEDGNKLMEWFETKTLHMSHTGYTYHKVVNIDGVWLCVVEIKDGVAEIVQILQGCIDGVEYKVSHFGKVLIISDSGEYKFKFYILNNDGYSATSIDGCLCKLSMSHGIDRISAGATLKVVNNNATYRVTEPLCSLDKTTVYFPDTQDDLWRGEIAVFAAARSSDGGILYTTPVQIFNTVQELGGVLSDERITNYIDGLKQDKVYVVRNVPAPATTGSITTIAAYSGSSQRFTNAGVTITIPKGLGSSLIIDNIAIYSTRLYPLLVATELYFIQKAELPNEPFYLLKTIPVTDFKDATYRFTIISSDLSNIENSVLYEPTQTANNVFGTDLFEYNNRLHILGTTYIPNRIDIQSVKTETAESEDNIYRRCIIAEYTRDSETYYSISSVDAYSAKFPHETTQTKAAAKNQGILLTFPGKITNLSFAGKTASGEYVICAKYKMAYSSSLNISYYIGQPAMPSGLNKYEDIILPAASEVENKPQSLPETTVAIPESNRIQVSDNNNCFVFPFENSYRIGSQTNKIIAANSAAIEMSDAKFGEFPLYVFTDEGIFTMQSGTDTLYSAIIPIAYDKAVNPNTLAVNYNVLFVTARGLMALSSNGIVCISAELNSKDNLMPEFLRTAKPVRLPKYNEVMVVNESNDSAYIYSLDNKVWSTRDIELGNILNNNEMITDDEIIDITDETDTSQPTPFVIDTRQVKLGTMELKRAETVIIRFESTIDQNINIEIYGSINLKSWILIRAAEITTNKDIIIRRVPMSVKYLRFRIFGTATDNIKIMPIDIEYYLRMLHRMR